MDKSSSPRRQADLVDGLLTDLGEHRLKDIAHAVPIFQLGEERFPPLRTLSNTNLPRAASSFVGRERELTEVLSRIEGGARLLTLTGPGGTSKTRLALEVALTLVPEYKAGVFWVGVAALRYGWIAMRQTRFEEARTRFGERVGIWRQVGDERWTSIALSSLASAIAWQEPATARTQYEEALQLRRKIGDERLVDRVPLGLSQILISEGLYEEAETLAREARVQASARGDGAAQRWRSTS